jgi:hypothetical protein
VRRTMDDLAPGDGTVRASDVRRRARQLLGRDSESLNDRMFVRVLKDAHDQGIIDLRRRGDDFEVARAADAAPVSEQLADRERAAVAASAPEGGAYAAPAAPVRGMGPRGAGAGRQGARGRLPAPPPDLLSIGVVETAPAPRVELHAAPMNDTSAVAEKRTPARGRRSTPAKSTRAAAKKTGTRARAKKAAKSSSSE